MAELTKIVTQRDIDAGYAKEILNEVLAHVEKGEVRQLVVVYESQDREIHTSRCCDSRLESAALLHLALVYIGRQL